jgi:hypothetical protein
MAELRRWRVESGGKEHWVEYVAKMMGDGEALVDGKVVASWGSSIWGLPKSMGFTIESNPATLRRVGISSQHFDLVFEGKVYSEKQGRV